MAHIKDLQAAGNSRCLSGGKAGVPVELGLKVCIVEDHHQFILHHRVMEHQTDDKLTHEIIREAQKRFPSLFSCSFDRGFYSGNNREVLGTLLEEVALPKKGKRSQRDSAIENSDGFRRAKKKHSAVESAINALEVHGLGKCLDHGIHGFKRYVALAITARNVQRAGALIIKREQRLIALRAARQRQ